MNNSFRDKDPGKKKMFPCVTGGVVCKHLQRIGEWAVNKEVLFRVTPYPTPVKEAGTNPIWLLSEKIHGK